jgi:transcription elongation factor Elf1
MCRHLPSLRAAGISQLLQDFKASLGSLSCRLCAASYSMPIHHLNEPIDVFSEWLDDCEAAANPQQQQEEQAPRYDDDDDDDDIPEASGLGNRKSNAEPDKKKRKVGGETETGRQTYADLGLDDSDDDDDDE